MLTHLLHIIFTLFSKVEKGPGVRPCSWSLQWTTVPRYNWKYPTYPRYELLIIEALSQI